MKRCSSCEGPFGLIVHRKWKLRFCSRACKKAHEDKQADALREAKQNWRPLVSLRCDAAEARRQNAIATNSQTGKCHG